MKHFHILVIAILLFSYLVIAQDSTKKTNADSNIEYYKVSKARIFVNNRSEIQALREHGVRFERVKLEDGYFDTFLDSLQIHNLKETGYKYQIIIDDVTQDYLERTKQSREEIKQLKKDSKDSCGKGSFGYGSMGGFYTFDEVVAELDAMYQLYPNLITSKDSVGSSYQGRPIWTVKISDNPNIDEEEPEIFYNSLIHAREPAGMMAIVYFMYYLLENYGQDPEVTYLVDNRELYFMPVINPDGYIMNQNMSPDGGGMWRKNLRGVDLNRNFDFMWGYDNIGSSPDQGDQTYRGIGPFSEPETQAIRDFCNAQNFVICNNYHSYWDVVFTPWGYNLDQSPDSVIFNSTIELGTQLNGYKNGHYILDNYSTNGCAKDWMYGEQITKPKIFAYLTEVGNNFWPSPQRILPLAEENCYLNKVLAWGPKVIANPPFIANANLNTNFCRPVVDTLKINAIETNPDNHESTVRAKIINSEDVLIEEFQLAQADSLFSSQFILNLADEEFYKIILEQTGNSIPSKLFYDKLRFTTAGPIKVDTFEIIRSDNGRIDLTNLILKNYGRIRRIENIQLVLSTEDTNLTSYGRQFKSIGGIEANSSVNVASAFSFYTNGKTDCLIFELKIRNNNVAYWKDTIIVDNLLTTLENNILFQPLDYALDQNYPNPFNPSTTIKYSIPKQSNVTIKVFDVLGSEIATLVNKEQPQGTYEVMFDGAALTSGIYFYSLQSGDPSTGSGQGFIETRKMSLLK